MDYYEEDIDPIEDLDDDPIKEEFEEEFKEEDEDDGLLEDIEVKESKFSVKTAMVPPPPTLSSDLPSGKDIAQVVDDLLNAKIFGDEAPEQSFSKIAIETLKNSDNLREQFEEKLKNIPLNKTEDYILNGTLYEGLASKALDANNQRIGTLNALAKFVPKNATKSQVNVAQQQMNNQSHSGVSPDQFVEVIKATEDAGLNPIARMRYAEEDAAEKLREEDEEDMDGDISLDSNPDNKVVYSPTVDDFN
jgi:hypothetical protein